MEVELITEGVSDDDAFSFDQNNDDYLTLDGERCGICMDIVIDRGVLDCCQHWFRFCFTCIDNWATITNLCPLCQNEFQLITCVPVYDTIGSSKIDEELSSREDDWCIEGKTNTLSFPSYYIDENAVICLDGDGCKIRSGSVTIDEDSNLDTSIACDSCDTWYHAFCVGFDTEGTCENSWLCPRCVANENPQETDVIPVLRPSNYGCLENSNSDCFIDAAFSRKVSVSVADAGETAVVVSMVGNQMTDGPSGKLPSTLEVDKDLKIERFEIPSTEKPTTRPVLKSEKLELCLSQDVSFSLPCSSSGKSELKMSSPDKLMKEPSGVDGFVIPSRKKLNGCYSANEPSGSSLDLHLGLSVGCSFSVDFVKNDVAEDQAAGDMQQKSCSEEYLLPGGRCVPAVKDTTLGTTGAKRKKRDYRLMVLNCFFFCIAEDEETKAEVETKASRKKVRAERTSRLINSRDQADESVSDASPTCNSGKENAASAIMSIVQGTDRRPVKGHTHNNQTVKSSLERENPAGLRMKKIMRTAAEDKESSVLVQKLRKEIREAVRNKSSKEFGENLFDPKLLDAFRAVVAGTMTEPVKKAPALVVRDKKLLLQKGKVRENLTKKIYGIGGKRKRAWTRDCEIEFWKHRCLKPGRPEKIETLKSVLNLLRNGSYGTDIKQENEVKASNPILSRLYLADTSVFPRKDDIKPLSDLNATDPTENKGNPSREKASTSSLGPQNPKTLQLNMVSPQVGILSSDDKGNKSTAVTNIKGESSSVSGFKVNSQKEMIGKSNDVKKDKRKWALEVLARKTATTGSRVALEKQEDKTVLKGAYPLLAQLPIDMRPVLAPSRHNKIPISVRQAQLYRLIEHFLRKANLPIIRRTADTEFAVADAVNIEKEVADRSNSKLVYINLMSQEILHRSDIIKPDRATESDPSPTSAVPTDKSEQATNDVSDGPMVEEALKNAGLLSDSPPNSPYHQMGEANDEYDLSGKIGDDPEPGNVFEMDSHPDLDIYGDFEYDLEDEDFIGASAIKASKVEQEESKIKVVFSTLNSNISNSVDGIEDHEGTNDVGVEVKDGDCINQDPLTDGGGEELSLAECEELYGPDKKPLTKRFPEGALIKKPSETMADAASPEKTEYSGSSQTTKASELEGESCAENLVGGDNAPDCSQTSENVPRKEKISNTCTSKQSDSIKDVSQKLEAYIKEHIRPLCKSGVITVKQYRWAVEKTTEKVMKYHSKEKNAKFLIKEGEKVKKLAQQYVETAQQKERT
ncbi:hypothetical protein RHSIM_Rhsim02G0245100 [Rhododendron simsii]|uniref:RING/U-box protein n=1 Tax=Rhododendron simsii TaxID=118357 RepID=A0A834HA87_RHOSS|nr:hypothetical protein RHSIM_Rhsim02G0245100 [Rhododendron simsii]